MNLQEMLKQVEPASSQRMNQAQRRLDSIAKPLNGLGQLEKTLVRLAGMAPLARQMRKRAVVFCADNGVVCEGVTQTDSSVTAVVAGNIARGQASVCVMAQVAGADVLALDVGMQQDVASVRRMKTAYGTANFRKGPAMTRSQALESIAAGMQIAKQCRDEGYRLLACGEMGIGNTTSSSAVASVLLGMVPSAVTGRGAGLSKQGVARKIEVIQDAIAFNKPDAQDPVDVLSKVGGFDLCAMCGLFLGGAMYKVPVLIDGLISSVAALAAAQLCPVSVEYMIASHLSAEPAARAIMDKLGLEPLLRLNMALGEGTGAVAAMPLIDMALRVYFDMPSFDDTGIEAYRPL